MKSLMGPWFCGSLLALTVAVGCKNNDEEAEAGGSDSASEGAASTDDGSGGSGSGSGGSGSGGDSQTGGVLTTTEDSNTPTEDSSTPTGGEPVACETPEGCTAMGSGDLTDVTIPFFRGVACVSDQVRPGDPLTISLATCVHPCLKADAFAFRWAHRDDGHLALALYHEGVTGTACPADVFGEFDPAACEFVGPVQLSIQPPMKEGAGSLLLPFLTNADAEAIAAGDAGDALWARIDAHAQAPERSLAINYAAANAAPPASCAADVAGCSCADILLQ